MLGLKRMQWLLSAARSVHTTLYLSATADKAALSQLRKRTGYPFMNCRAALIQFENNVDEAEKWLISEAQKHGWAKAAKLEGRAMPQGLVGVLVDRNMGAMVEISCETDFVARNAQFQSLVKAVTEICLKRGQQFGTQKIYWGQEEFNQLSSEGVCQATRVADLVALQVGNLGENMLARRGVFYAAPETYHLASYVHASGIQVHQESDCQLGKYAALLSYRQLLEKPASVPLEELGSQLCRHIVGMNPEAIGSKTDEPCPNADDEKNLLHQEFIMDPEIRVHEFLEENGIEVNNWVRFECGGHL